MQPDDVLTLDDAQNDRHGGKEYHYGSCRDDTMCDVDLQPERVVAMGVWAEEEIPDGNCSGGRVRGESVAGWGLAGVMKGTYCGGEEGTGREMRKGEWREVGKLGVEVGGGAVEEGVEVVYHID
jgi:hypothetical protein